MLNEQKGNMYFFVSHTWNAIKGECLHDCKYCYVKRWGNLKPVRLDEKEFNTDLGEDNFIFVGSSCDMFAADISNEWVMKVLEHCKKFDNKYLFQSKNPGRMAEFLGHYPAKVVFGTTLETNRDYDVSKAPSINERKIYFKALPGEKMITVEPIMDFDLEEFVDIIKECNPNWVNIGADSKGHGLTEPSKEKIEKLINELEKFTTVKIKDNLKRILKPSVE